MSNYIDRYQELYDRLGEHFESLDGKLWVEYNRMVIPVGPANYDYSISEDTAFQLLGLFPRCLLLRSTSGFKECCSGNSPWYAVVLFKHSHLNELPAKNRSEVRRGLKNCNVKMIDATFMSKHGYDVYLQAFSRYANSKPSISRDRFRYLTSALEDFSDIAHFWGVFHNHQLVGYCQNYLYNKTEVNYTSMKLNPNFLQLYSSYALIYSMNEYYLDEQRFEYANDGFRSILHETNFQEYLVKKFKFVEACTGIEIFYRPYIKTLLSVTYPIRSLLGGIMPKLGALYRLEEIRKETQRATSRQVV